LNLISLCALLEEDAATNQEYHGCNKVRQKNMQQEQIDSETNLPSTATKNTKENP
jgi:hypothetical protein